MARPLTALRLGFLIGNKNLSCTKQTSWLLVILAAIISLMIILISATDNQAFKAVIGFGCGVAGVLTLFSWIGCLVHAARRK